MMIKRFSFAIMCPFLVTHCLFTNTAFLQNLPKLSALLHMDFRILLLFISTFLAHMLTLIIYHTILLSFKHCMKSIQIRNFFLSVFSCVWTEYRKIRTRKNSVYGHFSSSETVSFPQLFVLICKFK